VADFPPVALGRIQPRQPARLRLDGFPWTQYGTISATVIRVVSQDDNEWLQVELAIRPNLASAIPLQRGLAGTVEVEVERVSPATLILRAAGQRLVAPDASPKLLDSSREIEQ
jgi:membrane fusion protein (multidrug efflux system)